MTDGTVLPIFSTSWPNVTLDQARTQDEFNNRFVRRLVDIRTALLSLDSRISADGTNIAANANDIATAKGNISALTARVDSLSATWNALQTDNAQFKQDVQTTVTGFQNTVSVFQGNITALTKQLNDASANIAELQRVVDPALLAQVINAYNNAKNEVAQAITNYDTQTVQPAIADLKTQIANAKTAAANANTDTNNSLIALQGRMDSLSAALQSNISALSTSVTASDGRITTLESDMAAVKLKAGQNAFNIQQNKDAQDGTNASQSLKNTQFTNDISTLYGNDDTINKRIDDEVAKFTQQASENFSYTWDRINTREQESKARDQTLQANIDNATADAIRREETISTQQTNDVAAAKARETAIETASQDRDTALDQKFTARTDAIEAAYKAADTAIRQDVQNGNDAQTATLKTYADEGDQKTLTTAKNYTNTQHDDAVNVAHAYTDTVAKGIIDIATTADNTANNALAIVTSLRDQVNDNTKRIAIVESNQKANTANIATLRTDVDTNTPRIAANGEAISALTARVGAAETYIASVNHAPYMMTPANAIPTLEYDLATISSNGAYNLQIVAKTDLIVNGQTVASGSTFTVTTANNSAFSADIWSQKSGAKMKVMGYRSSNAPYFTFFSTQTPSNV